MQDSLGIIDMREKVEANFAHLPNSYSLIITEMECADCALISPVINGFSTPLIPLLSHLILILARDHHKFSACLLHSSERYRGCYWRFLTRRGRDRFSSIIQAIVGQ